MRVLLIEDSAAEILILKKALGQFTNNISIAENGNDAISMFHTSLDENNPYDLVLLDLSLPGMDGHEVLLEIREEEQRRASSIDFDATNVIVLTGIAENFESLQFATSAGVLDYLYKPINIADLHRTLKRFGFLPRPETGNSV